MSPRRGGPVGLSARDIQERSEIGENGESVMKKLLTKLLKDEQGGEVLEYALIAGLIVVAAIAVIGTVGTKVLARWTSVSDGLDTNAP